MDDSLIDPDWNPSDGSDYEHFHHELCATMNDKDMNDKSSQYENNDEGEMVIDSMQNILHSQQNSEKDEENTLQMNDTISQFVHNGCVQTNFTNHCKLKIITVFRTAGIRRGNAVSPR